MTREEIINEIKSILGELCYSDAVAYLTQVDKKWLEETIKALEQEPCEPCRGSVYLTREAYGELCYKAAKWNELEKCDNAISRAEAIRVASGFCHPANVAKELAKLPSVNPAPCENVPDINVGKCKAESGDKE